MVGDAATNSGNGHAFVYRNGQMTDLNSLLPANSGWVLTTATAINNNNQIVGTGVVNGENHAFLMDLPS